MSFPNFACLKQSTSNIHVWNALAIYCSVESFLVGAHRIVTGIVVLLTQWAPWVTQLLIQISCQNRRELPFAIKNSDDSMEVVSFCLPRAAQSLYLVSCSTILRSILSCWLPWGWWTQLHSEEAELSAHHFIFKLSSHSAACWKADSWMWIQETWGSSPAKPLLTVWCWPVFYYLLKCTLSFVKSFK